MLNRKTPFVLRRTGFFVTMTDVREYVTESVVLDKEIKGERDLKVVLFSEALGRVSATVTSGQKITSKLSGHLLPMKFALVRLIEKNTFHVADALEIRSYPRLNLSILKLVQSLVSDREPEYRLWESLKSGADDGHEILRILGYDPLLALCGSCESEPPRAFSFRDLMYYCRACLSGFNEHDLYLL